MYMILVWGVNDFLDCVRNEDSSIKLFKTLKKADSYANKMLFNPDDARVISIEGVEE